MQLRLARLCCVLLLAQLAQRASGQSNFTVTVFPSLASAPKAAYTPSVMGVNMGHRYPADASWLAFLTRLGVNGARVFGVGGISGGSLLNTVGSSNWGRDIDGAGVSSSATFGAAVAQLRSASGRDPRMTNSWRNPPQWASVETTLATTDVSDASSAIDGNVNSTVASLAQIGIVPLVVTQVGCASFDFTVDSPAASAQAAAAYWGERFELYKHQYVLSRWTFVRAIQKIEFWNEPDLTAKSSSLGATCMSPARWLEQYTLRSQAIQNAYADYNSDVAAGSLACPSAVRCPLSPVVTASAFASRTFDGDPQYFGGPTVAAEHLLFPPSAGVRNSSWLNLQAYSYHSYGKEGGTLAKDTAALSGLVNGAHDGPAPLPVLTTEHASKTASSWNLVDSTSDDGFEASRLASQLIWMASYGLETYTFKFSCTPSNNGGIVKSGLHWGENSVAPFPVGDTTASGEAAGMVIRAMLGSDRAGGKPMYTCSTSSGSAYRPCALVGDDGRFTLLLVNDGVATASSGSSKPQGLSVQVNLSAVAAMLDLQDGSVAVVNELSSRGFYGEVSALPSLSSSSGFAFAATLPPWGVLAVTLPVGRQVVTTLAPTGDASVFAGANAGATYGAASTLTVGTSVTSTHDGTSVALIQFNGAAIDKASLSSALLELTVADTAGSDSLLTVVALNPSFSWSEGNLSWSSAAFSLTGVSGIVNRVYENFVRLDNGHAVAGHVTVRTSDLNAVKRVDVSSAVADGCVGFLIARRFRNNAYTGNSAPSGGVAADKLNGGSSVSFFSKEAANAAVRPQLRLLSDYRPPPPPSPPRPPPYPLGAARPPPSPPSPPPPRPPPALADSTEMVSTPSERDYTSSDSVPLPPRPPPPPSPPPAALSVTLPLTLEGIDPGSYDPAAVERAVRSLLGAGASVSFTSVDFPVTALLQFSASASSAASLLNATRQALAQALAVQPACVALQPAAVAGRRRRLSTTTVAYNVSVLGSASVGAAAALASALSAAAQGSSLAAQLAAAGTGPVSALSLLAAPTISAHISIGVTYSQGAAGNVSWSALQESFRPASLSGALNTSGVAFAQLQLTVPLPPPPPLPPNSGSPETTRVTTQRILGGVLGGVLGVGVCLCGVLLALRRRVCKQRTAEPPDLHSQRRAAALTKQARQVAPV